MKLIIFGASGGTGRQLVAQAVAQGHNVTAFARSPEKLDQKHAQLQVVKGDVLDISSVKHALRGQHAVLCALGASVMNKKMSRAIGTKNIIRAMEESAIKRFICQSGLGCGDSRERLPLYYQYLIMSLLLRYVYADHAAQEKHITASQLDWIIVRPANLTNAKRTASYWHGFTVNNDSILLKISRADVADFMLRQLTTDTYLRQSSGISDYAKSTNRQNSIIVTK